MHNRSNSKLTTVKETATEDGMANMHNSPVGKHLNSSVPQSTKGLDIHKDNAQIIAENLIRKPSISKSIKSSMLRPVNR